MAGLLSFVLLAANLASAAADSSGQVESLAAAAVTGETALHCELGGKTYRLEPWGANSIRVRVGADPAHELPQQALLPQPPKPVSRVVTDAAACSVLSGNLRAAVSSATGKLSFVDSSTGETLLEEASHSVCSGGAACLTKMAGVLKEVAPPGSITFKSSSTQRIYGLGEHRTGKLDNHGLSLDFQDAGVYDHHHAGDIILPWYMSIDGPDG